MPSMASSSLASMKKQVLASRVPDRDGLRKSRCELLTTRDAIGRRQVEVKLLKRFESRHQLVFPFREKLSVCEFSLGEKFASEKRPAGLK